MKNQLFIWLPQRSGNPIRWLEWNSKLQSAENQSELADSNQLSSLQQRSERCQTLILLPGEHCFYKQLTLPNSSQMALRSIPFQLEESLCQPLEQIHIATGKVNKQGLQVDTISLDRAWLQQQLDMLESLHIDRVVADFSLLPSKTEQVITLQDEDRYLCRSNDKATTQPATSLTSWWHLQNNPTQLRCIGENPLSEDDKVQVEKTPVTHPLEYLALNYQTDDCINLLQGEFEPQHQLRANLQQLKWPLIAAAMIMAVHLGSMVYENYRYQQQLDTINQQIVEVYKATFPEARRIINPRNQMRAKLRELEQQSGQQQYLSLLNRIAPVLAKSSGVEIDSIRFQRDQQQLLLQLTAPDYESLDQLNNAIKQQSVNLQPGSYQQNSNGQISAQIRISEVGDA